MYLYCISASDSTGYSYMETYFITNKEDITIEACKRLFEKEYSYSCFEYLYMDRGTTALIDLDDYYPANSEVLTMIDEIKNERKLIEDKERKEYERLKAKFDK